MKTGPSPTPPPNSFFWPGRGALRELPSDWEERRKWFWSQRERDRGGIVFVGDSIVAQWPNLPEIPGFRSVNRGICGDTTRGVAFRLREDVWGIDPALIVILCGINDLDAGSTPLQVASNLKEIHRFLNFHAFPPLLICDVPPRVGMEDKVREVNGIVRGVKLFSVLSKADGTADELCFSDGVHPNAHGYHLMEQKIKPAIEAFL